MVKILLVIGRGHLKIFQVGLTIWALNRLKVELDIVFLTFAETACQVAAEPVAVWAGNALLDPDLGNAHIKLFIFTVRVF